MAKAAMSKARQEVAVGEGLAVGCLLIGVTRLTSSKLPLEFAFRRVWPRWDHSSRFPAVHGTVMRTDIWRLLLAHDRRTSSWHATWVQQDGSLYPETRGDWEVEEAAEAIADDARVPVAAWVELAEGFVGNLKPDEFSRSDA